MASDAGDRSRPKAGECRFCKGRGWENDQNWEPRYPDLPQEREQGDGLIRCGWCLGDGVDPGEGESRETAALEWFGNDHCLELSYGYDPDIEGDEGAWLVHRVNGGINDREWTLIGRGTTPTDAIFQARQSTEKECA